MLIVENDLVPCNSDIDFCPLLTQITVLIKNYQIFRMSGEYKTSQMNQTEQKAIWCISV